MTEPDSVPCARVVATAAQAGFRTDRALSSLVPGLSRRASKALFQAGAIRLNGKAARGSESIQPGDALEYPDPAARSSAVVFEAARAQRLTTRHGRQVARLYEDAGILVLSKPSEIPVHKGQDDRSRRETLQDVLERAYPASRASAAAPEDVDDERETAREEPADGASFYFVHRLDMETSGCLVVAKTRAARDALIGAFQTRQVDKQYWAVVVGEVPWTRRVSRRPLAYARAEEPADGPPRRAGGMPEWARLRRTRRPVRFVKKAIVLEEGNTKGKEAETTFHVEERFRGYTLLRCEPRTGRTHQIRAHLLAEGFPLAYDALYGRRSPIRLRELVPGADETEGERVVLNRLPLHAWRIAFTHPDTGEHLAVEAPLPGDLRDLLRLLRKHRAAKSGR